MAETSQTPKSLKAQITRTSLVLAAAALLREQGPKAVTYRKVAKWAGAASSSVGYYFDSVTQLLHEPVATIFSCGRACRESGIGCRRP